MTTSSVLLGVNIDHIATLRNARGVRYPDPVHAAAIAEQAGADGITIHLREDRRHIQDEDVRRLRELVHIKLNLEMAATPEMVKIAIATQPHTVMLVPEGREEVTTEGGLDLVSGHSRLQPLVDELHEAGLTTSAFIDALPEQIDAAAEMGFSICEVHTGPYAHAFHEHGRDAEAPEVASLLLQLSDAGRRIQEAGMRFNAGHALNYYNVQPVAALQGVRELHIGHSIVSRSVLIGMRDAVREMKTLIREMAR